MSSDSNMSSLDGLPKQFVSSLRILFDILDETRSGYVRLADIESRWSDDGVRGLPSGVVDGLRKVTPPNGLLSFERFVAGLKLVLKKKRDTVEIRRPVMLKENRTPLQEYNLGWELHARDLNSNKFMNDVRLTGKPLQNGTREYENLQQNQSHRQPYMSQNNQKHPEQRHYSDSHHDAQHINDRHRKSPPTQIPKSGSMPRDAAYTDYVIKPEVDSYGNSNTAAQNNVGTFPQRAGGNLILRLQERDRPPAVPPRTDRMTTSSPQMKKSVSGPNLASHSNSPPAIPPRNSHQSTKILNDLKNWQKEWTASQATDGRHGPDKQTHPPLKKYNPDSEIYANIEQFQRRKDVDKKQPQLLSPQKATVQRHGSGRRHTLANGIDHNMMKRMGQLEEESTMLRSGMVMVEAARDWYLKQLASVTDKQAMLGKVTYNDNSVESYQERMNFQRARIAEINQHLQTLLESSEKGFPIHMNLAMPSAANKSDNTAVQSLKEQNRWLLEEMNQKKDHISQLEKEKASLVRELFEARSKNKTSYDDTTFM